MGGEPLAYFMTFRTYGTWLLGDDRGSTDRAHHTWGEPLVAPDGERRNVAHSRLKAAPVTLAQGQRLVTESEVRRQCGHRNWLLHAINVRTEHVHVVLRAASPPEQVMNTLKSYATRSLRHAGLWDRPTSPWSRHGSTRYLWADGDVEAACMYVNERQDTPKRSAPRPESGEV